MFKKPLGELKTSAPLRTSDRRKLRTQLAGAFALDADRAAALVPDGLLTARFATHLGEPGTLYLAPNGAPLWFALGKAADGGALVPTVYTLWKHQTLLPILTTPPHVLSVLQGGADLMAPGVITHPPGLAPGALVAIAPHGGAPAAVGTMAVPSEALDGEDAAGKAVHVLHAWKDHLWAMGKDKDMAPPPAEAAAAPEAGEPAPAEEPAKAEDAPADDLPAAAEQLTPDEISTILRTALIHAIHTTLASPPPGTFPLPASQAYAAHVLPARPAGCAAADVKRSSHKTLTAFLKAAEKEGLVALKHAKGDVLLAGVAAVHPAYAGYRAYRTVQQDEDRRRKAAERAKDADAAPREMDVAELWKPHGKSLPLCAALALSPDALYTLPEIKTALATYIADKQLANARDQGFVDARADAALAELAETDEFVRRDALLTRLAARMQAWHALGGAPPRAGALAPVRVALALRAGRKAATLVSGFGAFGVRAAPLAERLRVRSACATAVQDLPGKGAGQQVLVQGRQADAVVEVLGEWGVPRKWIVLEEGKKK